ncbi:DUF3313 domain-containing protein [Colwellia sp. E2M01]|nr:DUF3313 domain-containing protein [Colwellia sp. E2M01]
MIALGLAMVMACSHTTEEAPQVTKEGLNLVNSSSSALAYERAGVDFNDYQKVLILPSQVAFKKNWERSYNSSQGGSMKRITPKDVLSIKAKVADLFDEVFTQEIKENGTLEVVDKSGVSTLLLKPFILNLDITAPDIHNGSTIRTYTKNSGEATLYLEVYDGVSGEILARLIDNEIIGNDSFMQWANRVSNTADAKRTIKKWVETLRKQFETTKAKTM